MKDKSKESILKEFTKEQLISMINEVNNKNPSFKQEIEESIDKNKSNFEAKNNYSEYNALLGETERIISDFDELGGGDEEDEQVVYDNLDNIASLFQQGKLNEKTKKEFIEACFEYYGGNSGFENIKIVADAMDSNTSKNDFFDADGENRYVHVDPLHNDESIVGALMVVQNAGYINTTIREIWKGNLLRLLIQIIIFSITIFIILRFFVFRQVIRLVESVKKIRMGEG